MNRLETFILAMPHEDFVEFDNAVRQNHGEPLATLADRDPVGAFELVVEKAFEIGNVNGVRISDATRARDPDGQGIVSRELQKRIPNPAMHFIWVEVQEWYEPPAKRLLGSGKEISQRVASFLVKPPG